MPARSRAVFDANLCDAVRNAVHWLESRSVKSGKHLPGNGKPRTASGRLSRPASELLFIGRRNGNLKRHEIDVAVWHAACSIGSMRTTTPIFLALALAALSCISKATTPADPALIRAAAEDAVRAQAGAGASLLILQAAALDPRLRVASCDRGLTGFLTDSNPLRYQTTVGVRCEGSVRWTIYTSVRVESQAAVLVARRTLARNDEISAGDFKLETRRVPGILSAYVTDPAALAGQRLSRPIAADEPLSFEALAPANLIHRGQAVILLARSGSLEVRMNGIALGDGRASERIRVQNVSSQRVVEGIVRSESVVEAPL